MPRFNPIIKHKGHILAVFAIILTAVVAFGLAIPRLGYYHDDWYMLWSGSARTVSSLIPLFSTDRPFMGWIYAYTYRVLGENLIGWHAYALAWRIAGALAFYWILNLAFPKLKRLAALGVVLFLVYPGFLSIPNAATKVNHLTGFSAALFSIALTLLAVKTPNKLWKAALSVAAALLTAFYLWIYEYMIGLEVMRLLLALWVRWSHGGQKKAWPLLRTTALGYIPYAAVIAAFLYWRVFVFESTRVATDMSGVLDAYKGGLFATLLQVIFQTIKDFFSAAVFAWGVQPYQLFTKADNGGLLSAFALAAVIGLLAVGFVVATRNFGKTEEEESPPPPGLLIGIGALITLAAVLPVVATFRDLNLLDPYKSYGLHPSPGVIILFLGLALMLKPRFRSVALIALIALSTATQALNTQDWARLWQIHREFFWQLTWRAPDIQDGTFVMAYAPNGYLFQQDYEVWGPLNLIYRPGRHESPLIQSEVLNQDTAARVEIGQPVGRIVRDIEVKDNYNRLLLISQPTPESCIHVIDGEMPVYSVNERSIVKEVGGYSSVETIETGAAAPTPPAAIFGSEPERGWCYYYQQASLARQTGDWQRVGQLYDAAAAGHFIPEDDSEYFVFIEGLVNAGRGELATRIVDNGLRGNAALIHSWCESLASAPEYLAEFGYKQEEISQLICE